MNGNYKYFGLYNAKTSNDIGEGCDFLSSYALFDFLESLPKELVELKFTSSSFFIISTNLFV